MDLDLFINWIINTPTLFHETPIIAAQSPFERTNAMTAKPYHGNPRLGFLYQHLCSELFHATPENSVLAEEIQINDNGRTVGAIDFIVETQDETIQHWEVAIKFYLLHESTWYGPNAHDQLDKKLHHMLHHQLTMSAHPQFINTHPNWTSIEPHLLMQGRLYINPFLNQNVPTHCLDYPLNQEQISGKWCYQSQASLITEPLYLLEKHQWATGLTEFVSACHHFNDGFVHCQTQTGTFWFIVPDDWPKK